jgi:hypothetical protein
MKYIISDEIYKKMNTPRSGDIIWLTLKNKKNKIWFMICFVESHTRNRYRLHLRKLTIKEYTNHILTLKSND